MTGLPSLSEKLEKFLTLLVGFPNHATFFSQYTSVPSCKTYSGFINIIFTHWQRSEDGKLESQIVNVLQDIVEIIIQDVMVDGHLYV